MNEPQTKKCQNCGGSFVIEPDDFAFYEKIQVPAPTWCPECRMKRRMLSRNDRCLYRRSCDKCKKSTLSMYSTDTPFTVYCHDCWWSDSWDAKSFSRDYDFSRPFFEQFRDLLADVPRLNLFQRNSSECTFANMVGESKGVYLAYSTTNSEQIYYSWSTDKSTYVVDSFATTESERCYESIFGFKNYSSAFLFLSKNCIESSFLFDCVGCSNCFMCSNLRNKEYYFRNKKYTEAEYRDLVATIDFGSAATVAQLKKEFEELKKSSLHKYANITKSVSVTGDNAINCKNVANGFDVYNVENAKFMFRTPDIKDSMDCSFCGLISERIYEYMNGGKTGSNIRFSVAAMQSVNDADYVDYCRSSSHLFGCAGLNNGRYCILNKQYTKEEYEDLVAKIKKHMDEMPYVDSSGREFRYGEFFPPDVLPFAYNESFAQEYFPLTKDQVLSQGYKWRDPDTKDYQVTKNPSDLPDHIKDIDDSILNEVIGCSHAGVCPHQCATAFKVIPEELAFYRRMNLPLPRLCPNCRHYERLKQRNPLKLWHRQCMCEKTNHSHEGKCPVEFETSYAPDRKEIVYCEQCYNAEVV